MSRSISHTLGSGFLLVWLVFHFTLSASAQTIAGEAPPSRQLRTANVTAAVSGDAVRFTAIGQAAQIRLEVYGLGGERVYDSDYRHGNILDWRPSGEVGVAPLADGSYLLVVTVRDLNGRLRQGLGTAEIGAGRFSLRRVEAEQLTVMQQQALAAGRVSQGMEGTTEGDWPSLTVLPEGATPSVTVTGHDGQDGQITSTTGAITLRTGDVFAGKDLERVRVTSEGNVGIGTNKPEAKLDVAGSIRAAGTLRATGGVEFADGTVQTTGLSGRKDKDGNLMPNASGAGTQNRLAKWTDNAGTLGNSVVTEVSGRLGIGTTTPNFALTMLGSDIGLQLISPGTGATAADGFRFGISSVNDAFLFNQEATDMFFGTSATERMRIKANGNVGIGSTLPSAKLHVNGDSTNVNTPIAIIQSSGGQVPLLFKSGTNEARIRGDDQGNLVFATLSGGQKNISFRAGSESSTNMFIQSSTGNVGIGTTAPVSRLDVTSTPGQIRFGEAAADGGFLVSDSPTNATLSGGAKWDGSTWSVSSPLSEASMTSMSDGNIRFFTNTGLTPGATFTPTERMIISQTGQVGIGTQPHNFLDVIGAGTDRGGVIGEHQVVARFKQPSTSAHSAVSIDASTGRDPILYLAEQGTAKWEIRNDASESDRFKIRSRESNGTSATHLTIERNGKVGIGTTNPEHQLGVIGSFSDGHVALIHNVSSSFDGDVLKLVSGVGVPRIGNNFITFATDSQNIGAIQGNSEAGIELISGSGDYAEFLPRLNSAEEIQPGEIIGLYGGKVSKKTRGASKIMAVSINPIVVGNDPGEDARGAFERVAFIGQVMVRVRGKVQAGDYIIASGKEDGTGVAVSPAQITSEQFAQAVGQAWEASHDTGLKSVRVGVGLIEHDPTVPRLIAANRRQDAQISALKSESAAGAKQITELLRENNALRRQNASMDARLATIELRMTPKTARHKATEGRSRRSSKLRAG